MRKILPILFLSAIQYSCKKGSDPELLKGANAHFEKHEYRLALDEYKKVLKADRQNGEACYKTGLSLWELGRGGEAERSFQCAIDAQPENSDAYAKLIDLYLLSYENDSSADRKRLYLSNIEGLSQRLLGTKPDSCVGLRAKGQVELLSGRAADAIPDFQKCLEKEPDFEPAVEGMFYALWKSNRSSEAEEFAQKFNREHPKNTAVFNALKATYLSANEMAKAESLVRQRIQTEPENVRLRFDLAGLQIRTSRKDAAFATLSQTLSDFPKAETFLWVGDSYLEFGEYARAAATFKEGEKLDPSNRDFQKRQAVILARQGKLSDAVALLTEVLKVNPKDWKAEILQISLQMQSKPESSLDGIVTRLDKILANHPREAEVQALLGRAFELKGALPEAEQKYRTALDLNQRDVNALLGMSRLKLAQGEAQNALVSASTAISASPGNFEARLAQMEALIALGSYDSARSQLNGMIQQDPGSQRCRYLLADADLQEHRWSNAEAALHKLTAEGYEPAFEKLAEVNSLQGRSSEALAILKKQLAKNPSDLRLRISVADMASRAGQHNEAIAAATKLATEFPDRADIRATTAEIYDRNGNLTAALEQIREAERLEPEKTNIILQHADLLIKKKDFSEAITELDKILKRTPDHARALSTWARLQTDLKRDSASAVQAARRAYAAGSRDTQVVENAAYVYLKNGQKEAAVSLYRSLLMTEGKNPRYQAGLAEAQRMR